MSQSAAPRPGSIEEILDRVFLTPRVVDQRAYEELAERLKALVKEAASQTAALTTAAGEVRLLIESLRDASKELGDKVVAAERTSPGAAPDEALRLRVEALVGESLLRQRSDARMPALEASGSCAAGSPFATEAIADASVVRAAALAAQLDAQATSMEERAAQLREAEEAANEASLRLGAALIEAERRAQTVTTGFEAALADFVRRAADSQPPTVEDLRAATDEARRVGDGLARLVAQADALGLALDRMIRRAGPPDDARG